MSLFGNLFKKKESPAPAAAPGGEALRAFAAQFSAEEETLIALTGSQGFSCVRQEDSGLWLVELPITDWVYDNDPDELYSAQPGTAPRLVLLADDALLQVMRPRLMRNFILKVDVRADEADERFLLAGLPEPGFDPDLKAILDQRMTPVTFEDGELGELTLNTGRRCYQAEIDFADQSIILSVDGETEEEAAPLLATARLLMADQSAWAAKALRLTAELTLEAARGWIADQSAAFEEAPDLADADALAEYLGLEEIQVSEGGRATFWYGDGGMLLGRSFCLTFTPTEGGEAADAAARMEG